MNKVKIAICFLMFLTCLMFGTSHGQEHIAGNDYVSGEVVIILKPSSKSSANIKKISGKIAEIGLQSLDRINRRKEIIDIQESPIRDISELASRIYVLKVTSGKEKDLVKEYANNEHIESVSLNYIYKTALTPGDANWSAQWNYNDNHLQAEKAWNIHTGSANVIVGVIDTGLDHQHPDLSPNMWVNKGVDYCGNTIGGCNYSTGSFDNDPQHVGGFSYSHGTKIAGVIAARSNNSQFISGIAGGWGGQSGVQLMGLRAGYDNAAGNGGSVQSLKAAAAINWAMANTTSPIVFNMSFVGPSPSPTLQTSIDNAWNTGRAIFVGAALGANNNTPGYPAAFTNVVGVTGVLASDVKGTDTGYGSYVSVAAPVDGVPTVRYNANTNQHEYHITGGSTPSISAAQVSGVAALVWSAYPALSNQGVRQQIESTTDDISFQNAGQPWSGLIGSGRINAYRALTEWSGTLHVQPGQALHWSGDITVTGDVTIPAGTTLTIDPNTTIKFAPYTNAKLIVHGTLNATAGGITFRSYFTSNPSNSDWYGITVESGGVANISGATIRDASRCVRATNAASMSVSNNTLHNCGTFAIGYYYPPASTISGNTIYNSGTGIHIQHNPWSSWVTVSNNLIYNNSGKGVYQYDSTTNIVNNTIDNNNDTGVYTYPNGYAIMQNNSVTNNGGSAFYIGIPNDGKYNNVYNNSGGPGIGMAPQDHNISANPGYIDPGMGNYTTVNNSPNIDAGKPGGHGEPGGNWPSRVNIGRYGNTGSAAHIITTGIQNGDFESALNLPWHHTTYSAISGQTWDRVNSSHATKHNTWYLSTCNQTQGSGGGCHNSPPSEDDTGTMKSGSFKVTDQYLNFRLAGFNGSTCDRNVNYVRLRRTSDDALLFESEAPCSNSFVGVSWSVGSYMNEWVYLELVDGDNNGSYAWIAADYFEFSSSSGGSTLGNVANSDFEDNGGSLNSWGIISGAAWEAKNNTMPNKNNSWYATTCDGTHGDGGCNNGASETHTGTLKSTDFILTQPVLRFRMSGYQGSGCGNSSNYARLVEAFSNTEVRRTYVPCNNAMQTISWTGLSTNTTTYRIELVDGDSNWGYAWIAADYFQQAASKLAVGEPLPIAFSLVQNHPNPFNPETLIRYELPKEQSVTLEVYDLLGQKVRTLVRGEQPQGQYEIAWDGKSNIGDQVASGMYLYRLTTPEFTQTRKMTLLR